MSEMSEGRTVLLVEDDFDLRDIMQDVLEGEGYDVIPAHDGRQALSYLRDASEPNPDIVVLDLMLPMVSGWEVLVAARLDDALNGIPVIVVSAAAREPPPGAVKLLRKPFSVDALLESIDQQLRR